LTSKLTSKTLDGIYYSILYIVTADGSAYYLDRSTKTAYPADDTMAGYIYVVDEEVEANDGNLQS